MIEEQVTTYVISILLLFISTLLYGISKSLEGIFSGELQIRIVNESILNHHFSLQKTITVMFVVNVFLFVVMVSLSCVFFEKMRRLREEVSRLGEGFGFAPETPANEDN